MRSILLLLTFAFFITCCQEDAFIQPKSYPILSTDIIKVDENGALLTGKFITTGNAEILSFGFIFSDKIDGTEYRIELDSLSNEFEFNLNTDIEKGRYYFVKTFAESNAFISFGNTVSFTSMGFKNEIPVISKISPIIASDGYIVSINGKNFSLKKEEILLTIGGKICKILYSTWDSISFQIPNLIPGTKEGMLSIYGKEIAIPPIQIMKSVIASFVPDSGFDGTKVIINGDFFGPDTKVFFGNNQAEIIQNDEKTLTVISPSTTNAGPVKISVNINGKISQSEHSYTIMKHNITGISNPSGKIGKQVSIYGHSFIQNGRPSEVYFADLQATILNQTSEVIEVQIPNFPGNKCILKVKNGAKTDEYSGFQKITAWTKLANFPGDARFYAMGVSHNSDGYIGMGAKEYTYPYNDWWRYNSVSNTWIQLADFPGVARYNYFSFNIDRTIYVCFGFSEYYTGVYDGENLQDVWAYHINGDNWTEVANPNELSTIWWAMKKISGVVYEDKAYLLIGEKLHIYDPKNNEWSTHPGAPYIDDSYYNQRPFCFNIQNRIYWFFGYQYQNSWQNLYRIYEYIPESLDWKFLKTIDMVPSRNNVVAFVLNNKGYFGGGTNALNANPSDSYFWEFDPATMKIKEMESFNHDCSHQAAFVLDNKAYVGFGINSQVDALNEFYEFNPE